MTTVCVLSLPSSIFRNLFVIPFQYCLVTHKNCKCIVEVYTCTCPTVGVHMKNCQYFHDPDNGNIFLSIPQII